MKRATELKKGQRVIGVISNYNKYNGTVYSVHDGTATIERDDGKTGGGDHIPGYGTGWNVLVGYNGEWCSDGASGRLYIKGQEKYEKPY